MKCIFVARPYLFSVQYHAHALVAAHANKAWVMNRDGVDFSYRLLELQGADGPLDPGYAVFVPWDLGRRDAGRLLTAFNTVHPGIIPAPLVVPADQVNWWLRTRRRLSSRLDYQH